MKLFIRTAVLIVFASLIASAQFRTITRERAEKLVRDALIATVENGKSIPIEPWRYPWAPEFYTFEASWPGVPDRNGVAILQSRYFAVNPWTGDVWDAIACKRVTSSPIQLDQRAILKLAEFSEETVEILRLKSPGCCSDAQRKRK